MRSVLTLISVRIELNCRSPADVIELLVWENTHTSGKYCERENKGKHSEYFLDKSTLEEKLVTMERSAPS